MATVRQRAVPFAAGLTQASIVAPVVSRSELASGTVTQSLTPSNVSALPNLPAGGRTAPLSAPALPRPDASPAVVPLVSSKPHAPTRPVAGADTASVTATAFVPALPP